MGVSLNSLTTAECLALLASHDIGRIAVVDGGYPVIFPISYVLARLDGSPVIAVRTRPGNALDHVDAAAGFQIDEFDPGHDGGWSVLVRGTLRAMEPSARLDPHPLVSVDRDAWRIVVPHTITGRRVIADPDRWPFHPAAYL